MYKYIYIQYIYVFACADMPSAAHRISLCHAELERLDQCDVLSSLSKEQGARCYREMVVIQMEECVGQCATLRTKMTAILAREKAPIADQIAEMEALVLAHGIVQQEPPFSLESHMQRGVQGYGRKPTASHLEGR